MKACDTLEYLEIKKNNNLNTYYIKNTIVEIYCYVIDNN